MIKFFISCCTTNRFYAIILNISADKHNNFSCITCTIHYIRNVVLEEIVLQTIRKVAEYISQYEPVFLYLYNKQHKLNQAKELNDAKQKLTKSKTRIDELDTLIERIYEDNVLGKISDERFARMSANYEAEQKSLISEVDETEELIAKSELNKVDLKVFLREIRKCTDIKELTPTIVNTLIKRIDLHNPEIIEGHKKVKVDISFTAAGLISIPEEKELLHLMNEIRNEKSA